jgi:hypothetical protein
LVPVALLPFVVVVLVRWNEPPSATDGDYAHYLLHAKALAEGRPYTDIGYIYTEMNLVGPRAQPPGWPLVLAPFVAAFGTHSPVFKLLVTLLIAGFGVLAGSYFVRRGDNTAGIVATAVVPLALETQYATSSAISDPLFCVLVWLTFMVSDSDHLTGWRRGVTLAFMSVATLAVRVAGVALLPALLLHAILRRRDHGLKPVVPLAVLSVVGVVLAFFAVDQIPFLGRTFREMSDLRLPEFVSTYRAALATATLYPFPSNAANDVYHLLSVVPLLVGGALFLRRQFRGVIACFILVYVGVLLVSPVREPRYAWPLIPLAMVWITQGLSWVGARFLPANLKTVTPRLVLAMVAAMMVGSAVRLARQPARPSLLGDPDSMALFDWVRATSDTAKMRVVFTNPRVLTLETDVPAMGIPFGEANDVIAELDRQRITHVVVPRHASRSAERRLITYVSERPAQFPDAFGNATHDVRRFVARPEAAHDSGSSLTLRPQ